MHKLFEEHMFLLHASEMKRREVAKDKKCLRIKVLYFFKKVEATLTYHKDMHKLFEEHMFLLHTSELLQGHTVLDLVTFLCIRSTRYLCVSEITFVRTCFGSQNLMYTRKVWSSWFLFMWKYHNDVYTLAFRVYSFFFLVLRPKICAMQDFFFPSKLSYQPIRPMWNFNRKKTSGPGVEN